MTYQIELDFNPDGSPRKLVDGAVRFTLVLDDIIRITGFRYHPERGYCYPPSVRTGNAYTNIVSFDNQVRAQIIDEVQKELKAKVTFNATTTETENSVPC